ARASPRLGQLSNVLSAHIRASPLSPPNPLLHRLFPEKTGCPLVFVLNGHIPSNFGYLDFVQMNEPPQTTYIWPAMAAFCPFRASLPSRSTPRPHSRDQEP